MAQPVKKTDMRVISSSQASKKLGQTVKQVAEGDEPIKIQYHGRDGAVLISPERYEQIRLLEDKILGRLADQAKEKGYRSIEDSEKLLDELLNL